MTDKLTSEQRYGIVKQPPDTCPIINAALNDLKSLKRSYYGPDRYMERRIGRADTIDELRDIIDEISNEIKDDNDLNTDDIEEAFEKCREQASAIREWGQAWKDLAKENIKKVESVTSPWKGVLLWWNEVGSNTWYGIRMCLIYSYCCGKHSSQLNRIPKYAII